MKRADLMKKITAPTHKKIVEVLLNNKKLLLEQRWIAIDPASRSIGYALVEGGEVVEKGTIKTNKKCIGERLNDLFHQLEDKFDDLSMVAVELVRPNSGHLYLTWGAGVVAAGTNAPLVIEIPTSMWAKRKDSGWAKTDVLDALYIAKLILTIVSEVEVDEV